jgi:putative addiction module antidote
MATVTLRKVGNSLTMTIPADMAIRKRLSAGMAFTLVETDTGFRATRGSEELQHQLAAIERAAKSEADVLAMLAKA